MPKVIGTAHVPPTATIDSEITHRIPIAGLPACPAWCVGDCIGGEAEHLGDGVTIAADRVHSHILIDTTVADGDSYRGTRSLDVKLSIERYDTVDPDEPPIETRVLLDVEHKRLAPTSAQLREFARAALAAADLMDAALAAEGR